MREGRRNARRILGARRCSKRLAIDHRRGRTLTLAAARGSPSACRWAIGAEAWRRGDRRHPRLRGTRAAAASGACAGAAGDARRRRALEVVFDRRPLLLYPQLEARVSRTRPTRPPPGWCASSSPGGRRPDAGPTRERGRALAPGLSHDGGGRVRGGRRRPAVAGRRAGWSLLPPTGPRADPPGDVGLDHAHDHGRQLSAGTGVTRATAVERSGWPGRSSGSPPRASWEW